MLNPLKMKRVLRDTTHWPNKKCSVVEMISEDNSLYESSFGVAEVELALFLKCNLKINNMKKLLELIENYGDEKYSDGSDDEQMSNCGAEL